MAAGVALELPNRTCKLAGNSDDWPTDRREIRIAPADNWSLSPSRTMPTKSGKPIRPQRHMTSSVLCPRLWIVSCGGDSGWHGDDTGASSETVPTNTSSIRKHVLGRDHERAKFDSPPAIDLGLPSVTKDTAKKPCGPMRTDTDREIAGLLTPRQLRPLRIAFAMASQDCG